MVELWVYGLTRFGPRYRSVTSRMLSGVEELHQEAGQSRSRSRHEAERRT
ncbi:MAG: hypothetical protein MZU97_18215 [Bacillus subtilis]|nr:hypothetical protein [Bacillus subtilis]